MHINLTSRGFDENKVRVVVIYMSFYILKNYLRHEKNRSQLALYRWSLNTGLLYSKKITVAALTVAIYKCSLYESGRKDKFDCNLNS